MSSWRRRDILMPKAFLNSMDKCRVAVGSPARPGSSTWASKLILFIFGTRPKFDNWLCFDLHNHPATSSTLSDDRTLQFFFYKDDYTHDTPRHRIHPMPSQPAKRNGDAPLAPSRSALEEYELDSRPAFVLTTTELKLLGIAGVCHFLHYLAIY